MDFKPVIQQQKQTKKKKDAAVRAKDWCVSVFLKIKFLGFSMFEPANRHPVWL